MAATKVLALAVLALVLFFACDAATISAQARPMAAPSDIRARRSDISSPRSGSEAHAEEHTIAFIASAAAAVALVVLAVLGACCGKSNSPRDAHSGVQGNANAASLPQKDALVVAVPDSYTAKQQDGSKSSAHSASPSAVKSAGDGDDEEEDDNGALDELDMHAGLEHTSSTHALHVQIARNSCANSSTLIPMTRAGQRKNPLYSVDEDERDGNRATKDIGSDDGSDDGDDEADSIESVSAADEAPSESDNEDLSDDNEDVSARADSSRTHGSMDSTASAEECISFLDAQSILDKLTCHAPKSLAGINGGNSHPMQRLGSNNNSRTDFPVGKPKRGSTNPSMQEAHTHHAYCEIDAEEGINTAAITPSSTKAQAQRDFSDASLKASSEVTQLLQQAGRFGVVLQQNNITYAGVIAETVLGTLATGTFVDENVDGKRSSTSPRCLATILIAEGGNDAQQRQLLRLALVLRTLACPFVVPVLGIVPPKPALSVVFQKACDGTLEEYIKCKPTVDEALIYLRDVLYGLTYCHRQGILHTDLRCQHVWVCSRAAKLFDFGCSRQLSADADRESIKWMAPEIFQDRQYTQMSDVFSFGVTLFESCHFGLKPFCCKSWDIEQLQHEVKKGFKLPKTNYIPQHVFDIYKRCTNLDAQLRPTLPDLIDEFERQRLGERSPEDLAEMKKNCTVDCEAFRADLFGGRAQSRATASSAADGIQNLLDKQHREVEGQPISPSSSSSTSLPAAARNRRADTIDVEARLCFQSHIESLGHENPLNFMKESVGKGASLPEDIVPASTLLMPSASVQDEWTEIAKTGTLATVRRFSSENLQATVGQEGNYASYDLVENFNSTGSSRRSSTSNSDNALGAKDGQANEESLYDDGVVCRANNDMAETEQGDSNGNGNIDAMEHSESTRRPRRSYPLRNLNRLHQEGEGDEENYSSADNIDDVSVTSPVSPRRSNFGLGMPSSIEEAMKQGTLLMKDKTVSEALSEAYTGYADMDDANVPSTEMIEANREKQKLRQSMKQLSSVLQKSRRVGAHHSSGSQWTNEEPQMESYLAMSFPRNQLPPQSGCPSPGDPSPRQTGNPKCFGMDQAALSAERRLLSKIHDDLDRRPAAPRGVANVLVQNADAVVSRSATLNRDRPYVTPRAYLEPEWLHGALSRDEAEAVLMCKSQGGGVPGAFLIRHKPAADAFAITVLTSWDKIDHYLLTYNPSLGWYLSDDDSQLVGSRDDSLLMVIEFLKNPSNGYSLPLNCPVTCFRRKEERADADDRR